MLYVPNFCELLTKNVNCRIEILKIALCLLCSSSMYQHVRADFRKNNIPACESNKSGLSTEHIEDIATQESMEDLPTQQLEESLESSPVATEESRAEAARPLTPPLVSNLMEMGFTRPQVNVAIDR